MSQMSELYKDLALKVQRELDSAKNVSDRVRMAQDGDEDTPPDKRLESDDN